MRLHQKATGLRIFKNATTAVLVAVMLLFVSGCSGSGNSKRSSQSATGSNPLADGKLTVGVKFDTRPYGFIEKGSSEPVGFDIDITREIAKRLKVEPKYVEVNSDNRIPYLQTGRIDVIAASMFHTRKRDEAIDFSVNYFEDADKLLVPGDSSVKELADLAGKTVAVTQGSTQQADIARLAPSVKVLGFQDWPSAMQAVFRGDAEAVVSSTGILSGLATTANAAGKKVKVVGTGFAPGPVALGLRENKSDFRDALNFALMGMQEDGTYAKIYKKWWSDVAPKVYHIETWPKG